MNKQHLIGFIIFSLIVGTSVVVGSFYINIPERKAVMVADDDFKTYNTKKHCRRKKRKKPKKPKKPRKAEKFSVKLDQVVYNSEKEILTLDLSLPNTAEKPTKISNIALNFFVSDKYGTRHLKTEYSPVYFENAFGEVDLIDLDWLKNLQSRENLFVIPAAVSDNSENDIYRPVFIKTKAKPVLLN